MNNWIEFFRMFLSYLLVVGVTCILGAIAIFIGIKTRISKNLKMQGGAESTKDSI